MKLRRYIKKILGLLGRRTIYRKNFVYPNMYLFGLKQEDLRHVRKILFYFNNPEFMHLGDHLFFLPLIKTFIDAGYEIVVAPTRVMQPLFSKLEIPCVFDKLDFDNYDLIISRAELSDELIHHRAILVDVAKNLSMPICDQLIIQFGKYFALVPYKSYDFSILKSSTILKKFSLHPDKKYVLFNFYCDSSSFLINDRKIGLLVNLVKKYANLPNYQVILVGSKSDKDDDNSIYDFDYVDIRGQTSVLDVFALAWHPNVEHYIGFDAFVMHVFSLLHKVSFIVFRGRLSAKQDNMLRRYHVHLFNNDKFVQLISD